MRADEKQTDVDRLLGTLGVPELPYKSFLAAPTEPAEVSRVAAASTIARTFPLLAAAMPEIAQIVAAAQPEPPPQAPIEVPAAPESSLALARPDVTLQQQSVKPAALPPVSATVTPPPARPSRSASRSAGATPLGAVFRVLRGEAAAAQEPETHSTSLRGLFHR